MVKLTPHLRILWPAGIVPQMQQALSGSVVPARRAAAALLLELVQQTPELAEACTSGGGCASQVEHLRLERQAGGWVQGLLAAGGGRGALGVWVCGCVGVWVCGGECLRGGRLQGCEGCYASYAAVANPCYILPQQQAALPSHCLLGACVLLPARTACMP
jgi:hypothetical protein